MRAVQFNEFAGIDALRLETVADPVPAAGEVLVKVTAVGLNFFDTLVLRDKYQFTPRLPSSPGGEIAGVVEALGDGVTGFGIGERVMAYVGGNGCRERLAIKASSAIPIPDGVGDDVAAGVSITYGTAMHGFKDRAKLRPGETVAVLGAAGGAGLAAVEIAKLMGARVIAVASSAGKVALAKQHGADEGIDYTQDDLKTALKARTAPRGLDVLYDCVGGDSAEPSLRALGWKGRYLVIGFASGDIPRIPLNLVLLKGCDVLGVFWTAFVDREPEAHRANTLQVLNWCRDGKLAPHIHGTFPLAETAQALRLIQERKANGKVIVRPQE
ncbi:NADPH:quinone oxidoreductase family protein [Methyloceanibacter sp.]|uniref:NADPH:quinone oxidoreductase family protein n=1 Tax=Methyloceanibacter sp. TaxID=1965321 RepID=UPI002B96EDD2|nr:NADPH:quinone oxidoreductase family protein [Methyloceanibacter sp.]HML91638.1 NADPH:quinone oxidoreductase family protein [Methyloceanibacter sp.]